MESLKKAPYNFGILWLRMFAGLGMAYHGYQKIFVVDHMDGFIQSVSHMGMPFPFYLAWAAALSEFVGGILVAIGFMTRVSSFFIFCTMSVASFIAHQNDSFAVKELALAYLAMSGALMFTGGGQYSLDKK
jgi:putative oxidoreductase